MKFNYLKKAGVFSVMGLTILSCQNDDENSKKPMLILILTILHLYLL